MKNSEKRMLKKLLGVYNTCEDIIDKWYEPTILVNNKGIVRKTTFPSNNHLKKQIEVKIQKVKEKMNSK